MAAVTKMRDTVYYGRVRTWHLTLRTNPSGGKFIFYHLLLLTCQIHVTINTLTTLVRQTKNRIKWISLFKEKCALQLRESFACFNKCSL